MTTGDAATEGEYQRRLDAATKAQAEDTRHYGKLALQWPVLTGAGEALPALLFGPRALANALAVNVLDRSFAESGRNLGLLDPEEYSLLGRLRIGM